MTPIIIGIHGRKGTGKSTVAKFLRKQYNYTEIAFANALKLACIELYGLNKVQVFGTQEDKERIDPFWNASPRTILQQTGSALRPFNLFVKNVQRKIEKQVQLDPNAKIVISDLRYPDEAKMIKDLGGHIITIERRAAAKVDAHESEQQTIISDWTITNDKTKGDLFAEMNQIMDILVFLA